MIELTDTIRSTVLAALVGLSTRRLRQLAADGRLPQAEHGVLPFQAALTGVLRWRDELHAAKLKPADDPVEIERVRRLRRENEVAEHKLIPTTDVLASIDYIVGALVPSLLAIPPRVTDDVELRSRLEAEINFAMNATAERVAEASAALATGRDIFAEAAEQASGRRTRALAEPVDRARSRPTNPTRPHRRK